MNINRTNVSLSMFTGGYCRHPEWVTLRAGSLARVEFPAGFACIHHPLHGPILFDTGYASRFYTETLRFPYVLYAKVTPATIRAEDSALFQLTRVGIEPKDVRTIILSHFHADHIAGVRDFPHATFIYDAQAYEAVRGRTGLRALRRGFIPDLLPADFIARSKPLHNACTYRFSDDFPFASGYDIFGDGSIIAVSIPGHAAGQIGLFVQTDHHPYFLCADAVWSSKAYRENRPPHPLAGLIMSDRTEYRVNFNRIIELYRRYPELRIIPSHCRQTYTELMRGERPL